MKKNVFVIFGVSGLIGTQLAIILNQSDQYIIGITRNRASTHKKLSFLNEVLDTNDIQSSTFENPNNNFIFINLSGEPLIGIWTKNKRERVLNSRLDGTNKSKEIITKYNLKTSSIISASGIGIYENNFSELQSEKSKTSDQSFVSQMSGKLEERHHSFNNAKNVSLRFGIVLSNKGGSLSYLKLIYNLGLGGKIGNGNQWWSWIHIEDLVNAIIHIIKNKLEGPINITSPIPERQKDFAEGVETPTLLIKGAMSNILTEKEVGDFLEAISHSEFVEIKDAAHMVAGDRNDIFAAAAIEFLENHSPLKEN